MTARPAPIESPRQCARRMLKAARRYRLRGDVYAAALYLGKARLARLRAQGVTQ